MELRQYVAVIKKWWWLILLSTMVAAFFSWLAVRNQPNVYQTSTTMMIGQTFEQVNPNYYDLYTGERLAQTYTELIKREPILKETARALGFEDQWRSIQGQISVNLVPGTQLIEISVSDTDPARAKLITDEVAHQLSELVKPDDSPEQRFISEQAQTFPPKIEAAQQEIQDLEAELSQAFSAREIQDLQSQITTLQNQISSWQATFAQYQLLLGERGANVLTVIEEAPLPTVPVSTGWQMQVLLAAAIGLALGVGAAFLLEYLDDTLKTPEEVARVTGLTTVGTIIRISGSSPSERLVTVRHPKSPISEAYRAMRTNLQFSSLDRPVQSLVVTSPNPMEGKSTTIANLGVVMAQAGNSVVLVDSDLRRPMLHKIFQISNKEGLTSALLEEEPVVDGHLKETGIENLRIMTSGPLPPNPSELLGSQKMQRLIEILRSGTDVVIFDTPPALPVTDAAVLATQTDGVLIVTDAGKTGRASAKQAVESLRKVGGNLLGVVVNRLSARRTEGGYYYQYYYSGDGQGRRRRGSSWYQRIPLVGRLF
ncbi:MAG: polysaccharide biosynthesis tyrosine autokinase [Anaerolineae bacterium]|jgi:non-specific protein-tyrosine kinase